MDLPLNALRAFEVSARHLSFTRAAEELHLTQTAVSQHVRKLEDRLGRRLFRRLPRGLALTDEGQALLPVLSEAFERLSATLASLQTRQRREVLSIGVVGTFAVGWLLPRLRDFQARHPLIELRLFTHNNRVDLAAEGLDAAIRFGDGQWPGCEAVPLLDAPLAPVCSPALAHRIRGPADLGRETLLRSYRGDEWPAWFEAAGVRAPLLTGPQFDSSLLLADAAAQGAGVALLPLRLFSRDLQAGRLVRLFDVEVAVGRYWFTRLARRRASPAVQALRRWLEERLGEAG
ncbi:MAG: LysR family transcriptional regulator [Hydrogenophaga sp. SCN 70-13]|jgi:LysR family transcriptional regulator of beta-lactamase|uniref:transcriptional regulator GcvA n=1 Tax=unclassified Hydrogenophaga TaxID=2610897 RepID=UPI0008684650|nr:MULTISPECIES: transcriptional regulator GcvA [unclassified Hydrogenophaga]MBN9372267.1 transcriptional regulator GcvA [Hydrogenophaga sp.]ODT33976.1 MAG: LysR family transcriptional regulator [Hydrogenophaga sp. SCN 70-13]OJV37975.1 MAG: LysR family transcriptional regulator [Hydrogenophaga sp. 70-12]